MEGKTMGFVKGDPNINRNGRPRNAEPDLLRRALEKEGIKRGEDFWDKVAQYAFTDKNVMVAVVKKFIPDMSSTEVSGQLSVNQMPTVTVNGTSLRPNIGEYLNESSSS